jgi:hypothetical protein
LSQPIVAAVGISALIVANAASAQGMLLDVAADKVIKKYQTATCDELKAQKKSRQQTGRRKRSSFSATIHRHE